MKHITTWHPDTCDCVISYEWDDQDPEATRVHTAVDSKVCEVHKQHEGNHVNAMAAVMDENTRKNLILASILETFPHVRDNVEQDPTKPPAYKFKAGHQPEWHFDENRKLVVTPPTLDDTQKATLKGLVKPDKVEIV